MKNDITDYSTYYIIITLIIYICFISIYVPKSILTLINLPIMRLILILTIIYACKFNIIIALLLTIVLVLNINLDIQNNSTRKINEHFSSKIKNSKDNGSESDDSDSDDSDSDDSDSDDSDSDDSDSDSDNDNSQVVDNYNEYLDNHKEPFSNAKGKSTRNSEDESDSDDDVDFDSHSDSDSDSDSHSDSDSDNNDIDDDRYKKETFINKNIEDEFSRLHNAIHKFDNFLKTKN